MNKINDLSDAYQHGYTTKDIINQMQPFDPQLQQELAQELHTEVRQLEQQLQQKKQALLQLLPEQPLQHLQQHAPQFQLQDSWQRFERRNKKLENPFPLPWASLEHQLSGGLWPGLHILIGNTGTGKSQWALQIALYAIKRECPVLYVALELSPDDVNARLLALQSNIHWSDLWHGKTHALQNAEKALQELQTLPFHQATVPPYGWDYTQLHPLANAIQQHYRKPPLIIIDFLQLISHPPLAREDLRTCIRKTAYVARATARELHCPILMLSSTARDKYNQLAGVEGNLFERPATLMIGLAKESGEIEYAADSVLVLAKPPNPKPNTNPEHNLVYLGIAKRRTGKPGAWLPFTFNGARFEESTPKDWSTAR
ncbi:MAG: DnaB-like helicase C-terminal domain-containing protein [Myxococcota bacterium]